MYKRCRYIERSELTSGKPSPKAFMMVPRLFCTSMSLTACQVTVLTPLLYLSHGAGIVSDHFHCHWKIFQSLPERSKATWKGSYQICGSINMIALLYGWRGFLGVRSSTMSLRSSHCSSGIMPLGPYRGLYICFGSPTHRTSFQPRNFQPVSRVRPA